MQQLVAQERGDVHGCGELVVQVVRHAGGDDAEHAEAIEAGGVTLALRVIAARRKAHQELTLAGTERGDHQVDEPALVDALGAGRLGAAGLDVFVEEPVVPPALMALDNVVLMPHHASSTEECMQAMGELVVNNLRAYFEDGKALTPVG